MNTKTVVGKSSGAQRRKRLNEEESAHQSLLEKVPKLSNYFSPVAQSNQPQKSLNEIVKISAEPSCSSETNVSLSQNNNCDVPKNRAENSEANESNSGTIEANEGDKIINISENKCEDPSL